MLFNLQVIYTEREQVISQSNKKQVVDKYIPLKKTCPAQAFNKEVASARRRATENWQYL